MSKKESTGIKDRVKGQVRAAEHQHMAEPEQVKSERVEQLGAAPGQVAGRGTVDPYPEAPPMTAAMVLSTAQAQSEAGRLNRLRALARSNPDVAWLLDQAGARIQK